MYTKKLNIIRDKECQIFTCPFHIALASHVTCSASPYDRNMQPMPLPLHLIMSQKHRWTCCFYIAV